MADCLAPRHDDEPAEARPQSYLCHPCERALSGNLRRLPRLYRLLGDALATALQKRSPGSERGLPLNEPVSDCQLQICHDLAYWAVEVKRDRRLTLVPGDTVPSLCGFLHGWMTVIPFRKWAGDMAGALAEDAGRARALLDPFVKVEFDIPGADGVCLKCGRGRMTATIYASDGDRRRPQLACGTCGECLAPEQWLRYGERVIARRTAGAA